MSTAICFYCGNRIPKSEVDGPEEHSNYCAVCKKYVAVYYYNEPAKFTQTEIDEAVYKERQRILNILDEIHMEQSDARAEQPDKALREVKRRVDKK